MVVRSSHPCVGVASAPLTVPISHRGFNHTIFCPTMDSITPWIPSHHGFHHTMDSITPWIPSHRGFCHAVDSVTPAKGSSAWHSEHCDYHTGVCSDGVSHGFWTPDSVRCSSLSSNQPSLATRACYYPNSVRCSGFDGNLLSRSAISGITMMLGLMPGHACDAISEVAEFMVVVAAVDARSCVQSK
jgi:hypothetical protein